MATVVPTVSPNTALAATPGQTMEASWALTTANADGRGLDVSGFDKLVFQGVAGTAGSATLGAEGSLDGTNWIALTKAGGTTAATLTASGLFEVNEHPKFVRPNLSTAGSGAIWTARLFASK